MSPYSCARPVSSFPFPAAPSIRHLNPPSRLVASPFFRMIRDISARKWRPKHHKFIYADDPARLGCRRITFHVAIYERHESAFSRKICWVQLQKIMKSVKGEKNKIKLADIIKLQNVTFLNKIFQN